jgi:hypothetical protein
MGVGFRLFKYERIHHLNQGSPDCQKLWQRPEDMKEIAAGRLFKS